MVELLWAVAVILVLFWLLGFFIFNAGYLIHVLLILAVVCILYNLLAPRKTAL